MPSRASMQTGKSAARTRRTSNAKYVRPSSVQYDDSQAFMTFRMVEPTGVWEDWGAQLTIGDRLGRLGYATASYGKWHLQGGGPQEHGYDESDGDTGNEEGKYGSSSDPKYIYSMTRKAVGFARDQVSAQRPFFVTVNHYAEHNPVHHSRAGSAAVSHLRDIDINHKLGTRKIAAMVWDMDSSIGTLVDAIDELGVRSHTYVVFTSDHGTDVDTGSGQLLRGGKWTLWNGGIRVPLIVTGPGVSVGSRSNGNVVAYDFLPTFVDWAGGGNLTAADDGVDGLSLAPLLRGGTAEALDRRAIHFHSPHSRNFVPHSAVIQGDHKLLRFYDHPGSAYVYHLDNDLGETHNIAIEAGARATRVTRELNEAMDQHHAEVGAVLPVPNSCANRSTVPLSELRREFDPERLVVTGSSSVYDPDRGDPVRFLRFFKGYYNFERASSKASPYTRSDCPLPNTAPTA